MCNPVLILGAISAGSSAMSIRAQNQAADAQVEAAEQAAVAQRSQAQRRQLEEGQAISAKAFERMRQANRERAKIRASASNQGVAGVGASRALSVSDVNAAIDISRIYTNLDNSSANYLANLEAIDAQRVGRINQANASMVGGLAAATQVGLAGIQGAMVGAELSDMSFTEALSFGSSSGSPTGGGGTGGRVVATAPSSIFDS